MLDSIKAGLVLGSARPGGWTRKLGRALVELAPAALSIRPIELADLPVYHEELEQPAPPPAWARFRAEVAAVDALLFVTPEYNRSVPAALKNAIDIGSSPDDCSVWSGKPAAIATFSTGMLGGFGANHHLRQSLVFLDLPVMPQPEIYLSHIERLFDDEGTLRPAPGEQLLTPFLQAFAAWCSIWVGARR
jgi:chromate reductase